jgi:hypothetical protein
MRKRLGLELTDRVQVVLPAALADRIDHAEWIKDEVLAVSVNVDDRASEPTLVRVSSER